MFLCFYVYSFFATGYFGYAVISTVPSLTIKSFYSMQKYTSYCLAFLSTCFSSTALFSQHNFFTDAGANKRVQTDKPMVLVPEKFRTTALDIPAMKSFLWSLPSENAAKANRNLMPVIELPMPDGAMARFQVWESSIQAPELEAKFPDIKTFAGQGIDTEARNHRIEPVTRALGQNIAQTRAQHTQYAGAYQLGAPDQQGNGGEEVQQVGQTVPYRECRTRSTSSRINPAAPMVIALSATLKEGKYHPA